jgi:RNA polymerase sigma-70 factor (ECF subfamily)
MGTCVITSARAVVETSQTIPDAISKVVSRAQDGDREAFATLFELHKKKVYSICLRMTGNVAEAEDLTQDAFLQVFCKLASFRGDSLFSTWLYRIAVNTVLMTLRRKRFRQVSLDEPIPMDSSCAQREVRHDDLDLLGSVDRIALASAIRELPPGCRMIFRLHEEEGYDHHEIAQMLRCSVGSSKSQLHKARWKMRSLLFPHHKSVSRGTKNVKPKAD